MPSPDLFLGVDIGTTAVKVSCIDLDGIVHAQARREYPTAFGQGGRVTQDPERWWLALQESLGRIPEPMRQRVAGVAVSSHAPTLLAVAEDGTVLQDARIWADRTAAAESRRLESLWGQERITALVGNRMDPYFLAPKLVQLRSELGGQLDSIPRFVQPNGWIAHRMTGAWSIDDTHAALTQLYSADEGDWSEGILEDLGLRRQQLPRIHAPSERVGSLTGSAAQQLGLRPGVAVYAGAIDGSTSALGAELVEPGELYEMSGQSSGVGVITEAVVPQQRLLNLKHAVPGRWILKGSMSSSGGSLRWLRDLMAADPGGGEEDFAEFSRLAEQSRPGSGGVLFLPYLLGERAPIWDPNARGVWFGLSATTSRADLIRSIMEGTAFGLRSVLSELAGLQHGRVIHGSGGGYLSPEWTRIKADVLGLPIRVTAGQSDTASRGSALLALLGSGAALPKPSQPSAEALVAPDDAHALLYGELHERFVALTEASQQHFSSLADIRARYEL